MGEGYVICVLTIWKVRQLCMWGTPSIWRDVSPGHISTRGPHTGNIWEPAFLRLWSCWPLWLSIGYLVIMRSYCPKTKSAEIIGSPLSVAINAPNGDLWVFPRALHPSSSCCDVILLCQKADSNTSLHNISYIIVIIHSIHHLYEYLRCVFLWNRIMTRLNA